MKDELKDPLAEYARVSGKSDAAIGRLIGVSRWTISRGRSGKQPLQIADQIALEEFTGVTPAEWGEYYSKVLKGGAVKKNGALSAEEAA